MAKDLLHIFKICFGIGWGDGGKDYETIGMDK